MSPQTHTTTPHFTYNNHHCPPHTPTSPDCSNNCHHHTSTSHHTATTTVTNIHHTIVTTALLYHTTLPYNHHQSPQTSTTPQCTYNRHHRPEILWRLQSPTCQAPHCDILQTFILSPPLLGGGRSSQLGFLQHHWHCTVRHAKCHKR